MVSSILDYVKPARHGPKKRHARAYVVVSCEKGTLLAGRRGTWMMIATPFQIPAILRCIHTLSLYIPVPFDDCEWRLPRDSARRRNAHLTPLRGM